MVITSYNILASEHGSFSPATKDESKKKKTTAESDSEDSDSPSVAKAIKARPKKVKDALLRVTWWRVVLGILPTNFIVLSTFKGLSCRRGTQYQEQNDKGSISMLCARRQTSLVFDGNSHVSFSSVAVDDIV